MATMTVVEFMVTKGADDGEDDGDRGNDGGRRVVIGLIEMLHLSAVDAHAFR